MYAVAPAGSHTHEGGDMTGVSGEPVRTVEHSDLAAVVGTVPLAQFGESALARNLEDMAWLEAVARAHDAVVSRVARHGAVVPLRLATVALDDSRVRDLLEQHREEFRSALVLVEGRTEWGVKAFADRKVLTSTIAEARTAGAEPGSGTAYLLRRRAQLAAQETLEREAAARTDDIHEQLVRAAAAGRRQPPTDPALRGNHEWMVLNGTYLVDDDRTDDFAAVVHELDARHQGIRLELTGPWPPYSFAGAEKVSP